MHIAKSETGLTEAIATLRALLERSSCGFRTALLDQYRYERGPTYLEREDTREPRELDPHVFDLLFCSGAAPRDTIVGSLGAHCVMALVEHCIIEEHRETLRSSGLTLRPYMGYWLFAGKMGDPPAVVHFGSDSRLLATTLLSFPRGETALDLCAGSGIQALVLGERFAEVTAVEIEPSVAAVAKLNVALSGRGDRVAVVAGDLFDRIEGRRFDAVVSNPPFAPSRRDYTLDRAGAGGIDGLDIVRRIWARAGEILAPGGRMVIITGMFGDEKTPGALDELRRLSDRLGRPIHVDVIAPPASAVTRVMPGMLDEQRRLRLEEKRAAALEIGATHYYYCVVTLGGSGGAGLFFHPFQIRSR
jgi:precorrin-6B methylase 2